MSKSVRGSGTGLRAALVVSAALALVGACDKGNKSGGGGGGDYDPASRDANNERQLAEFSPGCDAGVPVACWMVAEALAGLKRDQAAIEAAYGKACRGGLGNVPSSWTSVCEVAGALAERPGGAGPAAARDLYELGCARGGDKACAAAFRLAAPPSFELAAQACRLGTQAACVVAADAARRENAPDAAAYEFRGCELGEVASCQALGRRGSVR